MMGGKSILVRTGYGKKEEKYITDSMCYYDVIVCDNLEKAGELILKDN